MFAILQSIAYFAGGFFLLDILMLEQANFFSRAPDRG